MRSLTYTGTGSTTRVAHMVLAPFPLSNESLVKEKKQLYPSWGQPTALAWTRICAGKSSAPCRLMALRRSSMSPIGYGTSIFQRLLMSTETAAFITCLHASGDDFVCGIGNRVKERFSLLIQMFSEIESKGSYTWVFFCFCSPAFYVCTHVLSLKNS